MPAGTFLATGRADASSSDPWSCRHVFAAGCRMSISRACTPDDSTSARGNDGRAETGNIASK